MSDSKGSSFKPSVIYAPLPETERGKGIHINATARNDKLAYTNGRVVVVRSLADPSIADVFTEHKAKVNVAAFNPTGNYIASGDADGKVIVWEVDNKKIKSEIQVCRNVLDIQWSPDGNKILAVGDGGDIRARVFDWETGTNKGEIIGHYKTILSGAMRPARPFRAVTVGEDFVTNFHEGVPFKMKTSVAHHNKYANCVRFSPDGSHFVTVGSDSKIFLHDGNTGELKKSIESKEKKENHQGSIFSVSWSADNKHILTASGDKTAKIWNTEEGTLVKTFTFGGPKPQVSDMQVAALWHGQYLITVSLSGVINYLDESNPSQPKQSVYGHKGNVTGLAIASATSGDIFTTDSEGVLLQWDPSTKLARPFTGKGHSDKPISGVALNANQTVVATIGLDNRVLFSDVKSAAFDQTGEALESMPEFVTGARKDADLFAVTLGKQKVLLFRKGKLAFSLPVSYVPTAVSFSLDDTQLLVGGKDNKVHVYKVERDTLIEEADQTKPVAQAVVVIRPKPDGDLLHVVDKSRTLGFYNDKNEQVNSAGWRYHNAAVADSAWSLDGTRLATGSADDQILVWSNFTTFEATRLKLEEAHSRGVALVNWLNNQTLISVGCERVMKQWPLP